MQNYLQPILTSLFTSDKDATTRLSGGARLDWTAKTKTLTATRLNRGLQGHPSEQNIFEREIRAAGYAHTEGEPVHWRIDDGPNQQIGVKWVISKAKPKPASKAAMKSEMQGSLF